MASNLVTYLNNNLEMMTATNRSANFQNVFSDQLLPKREISGVLSLRIMQLVRVAELSSRI